MSDQPIEIVEYDPSWPSKFELEKELLESLIGSFVYGSIEHVGSTSISGLAAKPVIDIMVGVESLESSRKAIDLLSSNGYCYYPYKTEVMHWFCKPKPEMRTHHLHLVPYGRPLWLERITFRDHLRVNPTLAAEYAALKHKLSEEHENDRDLYTEKKWPFVKKVLESIN